MARLLDRDRLCSNCFQTRHGPDSAAKMNEYIAWADEFLHCSGCLVDHPGYVFSHAQRTMKPEHRRCYAWEGVVHLCPHKSFTWAEIQSLAAKYYTWRDEPHCSDVFICKRGHGRRWISVTNYKNSCFVCFARGGWLSAIDWQGFDEYRLCRNSRSLEWDTSSFVTSYRLERKVNPFPLVPSLLWYRSLEATSISLTTDPDSYGVTWCFGTACYHHYQRQYNIPRYRAVTRPCSESCPVLPCR